MPATWCRVLEHQAPDACCYAGLRHSLGMCHLSMLRDFHLGKLSYCACVQWTGPSLMTHPQRGFQNSASSTSVLIDEVFVTPGGNV